MLPASAKASERNFWSDPLFLISLFCAFGLLFALARPLLSWWYFEYTRPHSYYGHAFFVPPLILLMLWHIRETLSKISVRPAPIALIPLLVSVGLLVLAQKKDMKAVMSQSFLLSIVASIWLVLGTAWVRKAIFPLVFLWLMAPLPGPLLNDLTLKIQSASTEGAVKILQCIAFSAHRDGNIINLENFTLVVDVPCSGFQLLFQLITFSAAFAFLTDGSAWRRLCLFVISLPLSVLTNSIRIACIGVVGECFGSSAGTAFHDWSGILSLVLCMVMLFGAAKVMGCKTFAGQPIF